MPKQFVEINGQPVLSYSLRVADALPEIAEIIVNAPDGYREQTKRLVSKCVSQTPCHVVDAGRDRQESVQILCNAATFETIILHEAARPMVTSKAIKNLLNHPAPNVGICAPIHYSMCRVDLETDKIISGVCRDETQNIQLPQKFSRATLLAAHDKAALVSERFTEDAILCIRMLGTDIFSVTGDPSNIKITTPEDFAIAGEFLTEKGITI